jgi:hypothetical protein
MPDRDLHAVKAQVSGADGVRTEQTATAEQMRGVDQDPVQSAKALARARIDTAEVFDDMLDTRWTSDAYSNRALARRYLGVDERIVRKWRSGDKPIPLAALLALPLELAKDLSGRVLSLRAGGYAARSTTLLAESLDQIALLVKSDYIVEVPDILPKLRQAQRSLDMLIVAIERKVRR